MPDPIVVPPPATAHTISLPLPETIAASGSPEPTTDAAPEIGGTPTPPSASVIAPSAKTAAAEAIAPMQWQPKRPTNWLAAILDTFRDAVAGHPTQIYTDANGNRYVGAANETSGQKWARIAANAAQGAAAGYAAGQGPAGQGRAALAGMNAGIQQTQQQRQQTKEQQAAVRQDTLDKFNSRMMELKYQEQIFRMTRLNVDATHEDWRFSKEQIDYARKQPGAVDLGAYEGPLDLHKIQARDPNAQKDWVAGKIEVIQEINPDGKRAGVHYILHPTPMQERMAPKGSPVVTYVPPTSGDPKDFGKVIQSYTDHEMKESDRQAVIIGENKKLADAKEAILGPQIKAAELEDKKAGIKAKLSEANRNNAEAAEHAQKARMLKAEEAQQESIILASSPQQLGSELYHGKLALSQLRGIYRGKEGAEIIRQGMAWASKMSQDETGKPMDWEKNESDFHTYDKWRIRRDSGDIGDTIRGYNMFFNHLADAQDAIEFLGRTQPKLLNKPYNEVIDYLGKSQSGDLLEARFKLETAMADFQMALKDNKAALTIQDMQRGADFNSASGNLTAMKQGMSAMAEVGMRRMQGVDAENIANTHGEHVENLLTNEARTSITKLKDRYGHPLNPNNVYSSYKPTYANAPAPTPNPAAPQPGNLSPDAQKLIDKHSQ